MTKAGHWNTSSDMGARNVAHSLKGKYMRKTLALSAMALATTLALTACGSSNDSSSPGETAEGEAPVSAPTATPITPEKPTPTPESDKSVRGNLLMSVGDIGTVSDNATGNVHVKFTVTGIKPIKCDQEFSRPSENGQLIAVDITAETTPELAQDPFPKYTLSSHDFKFIDNNGTTYTGNLGSVATYSCIADNLTFPADGMGPAEKLAAKIVLDVPKPHGILVLKSGYAGGFEYKF